MNSHHFKDYMNKFEKQVMIPYSRESRFDKKINISVRGSKLIHTDFGGFLGDKFEYEEILTFNYYGLMKVSSAFISKVDEIEKMNVEIKAMLSKVVHFASVRIRVISKYSPELLKDFSEYKDYLLSLRQFQTKAQRHG